MSSIEERVKKIVVEQLGVKEEEVTTSASFVDDLGAETVGARGQGGGGEAPARAGDAGHHGHRPGVSR